MFVCFCVPISFCRYYFYVCVCASTYFTVNYILSNYLCKSFNFYKRVLATQKSRLVLLQLLLLVMLLLFEGKITLKAPT